METIPENFRTKFQEHRFNISPKSMEMMKDLQKLFIGMQEKYPELVALSFYGSRIREQESSFSDLDVVIFKDSRKVQKAKFHGSAVMTLIDICKKISNKASFSVYDLDGIEGTLKQMDKWGEIGEEEKYNIQNISMEMVSPFLLSIGNIYDIREKILNALQQSENGEKHFKGLMKQLQVLERPNDGRKGQMILPEYKYPETLAEGKDYFLRNKQL